MTGLVLTGWAAVAFVMGGAWLIQRRTRDAGPVDALWALGVGGLAALFAIGWPPEVASVPARRAIAAALAGAWSLRLAAHILARGRGRAEDGRYADLRRRWGRRAPLLFLLFFQVQGAWSVLFALPILVSMAGDAPLGLLDGAGIAAGGGAIALEAVADRQLGRFRARADRGDGVCREGLWRYSRHPNYFFEWLHWWSYVLLGASSPLWPLTLGGPALMLLFLTRITGIPPTEAQALRSRGEAYREYQRTTSAFFPWPPRAAGADRARKGGRTP